MKKIETGTEHLLATEDDGVAVLTMNRPERRNAMSGEMLDGMARALDYAERAAAIRCIVLTGAGGGFCAGGDVKGMAAGGGGGGGPTLDERIHAQRLSQRNTAGRIYLMPKPVIAMLPGPAAGAGLSLALACDMRVLADNVVITTAFARVGFSGDYGGTFFLSQLVGSGKARELYYRRTLDAECHRLGIANACTRRTAWKRRHRNCADRDRTHGCVSLHEGEFNRAVGATSSSVSTQATHHIHGG
jgi:2-(1,2-epoxy-1,2-dihydrophenyl)acetyl-CoA isomerase